MQLFIVSLSLGDLHATLIVFVFQNKLVTVALLGWLKITKFLLRHGSSLPGVRNTVVIIMKQRKFLKKLVSKVAQYLFLLGTEKTFLLSKAPMIPRVFGSFCNFFCNWAGIAPKHIF